MIDRYLQDVRVLQSEGWAIDDIAALTPHELEVLAHLVRLPELLDLSVGTSTGTVFAAAAARLEAGRRIGPSPIVSIPVNPQHTTSHTSSKPSVHPSRGAQRARSGVQGIVARAWRCVRSAGRRVHGRQ